MDSDMKPVTSAEHVACLEVYATAADDCTKAELRRRMNEAVKAIRQRSGEWAVHAESCDMPGPGHVVSTHPNEAEALTECIRLNQAYDGDAGAYTTRKVEK